MAAVLAANCLIRQPVKRIAIAWLAMAGLLLLAIACAMPFWPRLTLINEAAPVSVAHTFPTPAFPTQAPPARAIAPMPARPMISFPPPRVTNVPQQRPGSWITTIDPPALVAAIYLMGAAATLAWLLIGAIYSYRLRRRALEAPDWARELLRNIAGDSARLPRLVI